LANNKIQVKRSNVAGRTANVTNAGNTQYIDAGEFALNMADQILYTSNGSTLITVGANLVNQRITNSLTLDNDRNIFFRTVNTSASVGMRQQSDDNFVFYSTNTAYGQRAVWSIFANSITSAFSLSVPTTFNGNVTLGGVAVSANGSTGSAGQVLTTNGSSTYWSTVSGGGGGTVTSVATGNGMTGGTITTTGTVSVLANTGIVANTTGLFVNATYITSLSANLASPAVLGSTTANGASLTYANVSGQVNTATLFATTSANVGANVQLTTSTLLIGNSTINSNHTSSLLQVANSTTIANVTAAGIQAYTNSTVNSTVTASLVRVSNSTATSNLTAQGLNAGANVVANTTAFRVGNTTLTTTNAVFGGTIVANGGIGSAGQVLTSGAAGNAYWTTPTTGTVTSVASGNGITGGTITATGTLVAVGGVGTVVNTGGINVLANTGIVANTTGTFVNATYIGTISANNASFLGTVAAASYVQNTDSRTLSGNLVISGTSFTPSSNTILLGNSTQRWVLSANTGSFSGAVSGITTLAAGNTTITGFANVTTSVNSALLTVGTAFIANTTGAYHTGVVNAATLSVGSSIIANTTRLAIGTAVGIQANGGVGTDGQVLTSNGTTVYWAAAAGGGYYKGGTSAVGSLAVGGQNLFRVNANTLNTSTTFVAGENAQATGPIAVAAGITLTVQSGARVSIV
jgi:hypothetical protein